MKTYNDYIKLAREKNVTFLERKAPRGTRVTCRWRCNVTGAEVSRSFDAMQAAEHGSRYQKDYIEQLEKYHQLAEDLSIEFVYDESNPMDYFPKNTKTMCNWRGPSGDIVRATYHQLGYGQIPQMVADALGLEGEYA